MKITMISILAILFLSQNLCGQTRTIIGRVITEDLEPKPMQYISNSDNVHLGKTDMDGRFKISIPLEIDRLIFNDVGMERTEIKLRKDCDTVEVIMLNYAIYDFISSRKIDRLRKKIFDNLPNLHSNAVENGLFKNNNTCYERFFKADKPVLDSISKVSKKEGKANKNNFKDLKIGDVVKIPFGLDSSKKRISTHYSPCENCTKEDYDYIIEGEILDKYGRKLTLEIKITEMPNYETLEYRGKDLRIGSNFKYEMKYFEVIINK
jgi:hypothetical protein